MTTADFRPESAVTARTEPFWTGGLAGELRLQRCEDCDHIRYPVAEICPRCLSPRAVWTPMSGGGIIQTFVIFERAYHESWKDRVPYVVALVELDEGPVFLTNVIGTDPAHVAVGQRVTATFERRSATAALPQFRPAPAGEQR
jgi:uncharacterized OB-fold protein